MQAMPDEGQRDAFMCPAASERYVHADMRECDSVCREYTETLKRKRQEDQSRSFSTSTSSLMTWADRVPEPMHQPPPRSMLPYRQLSPVIREEDEEYIYDSRYGLDDENGGLPRYRPLTRRWRM